MKALVAGAVALVLVGAVVVLLLNGTAGDPVNPSGAGTAAAPPAAPAGETAPVPSSESKPRSTPRPVPRTPDAPPTPPSKPVTATLVVTSDVPGASVFVDRKFVGTSPLTLADLPPGTRQLKLTADGHDGIDRTVDLEPGENPVTVRFREVRLNARVAVDHKHGVGSCDGTLIATVDGLSYQTTHTNDAFRLSFDQLETFQVNYLEKNLRVKQRGGRTWNFTDKGAANADALFVFHREVEAAREKLAKGYTPVR